MSAPHEPDPLQAMRLSYGLGGLQESDLAPDWLSQLQAWLEDARAAEITEPNAMVLATAAADGAPSARTVLLKGLDEHGLVFYTNRASRKGRELEANPSASVVFPWYPLQRQVIVCGTVSLVDDAQSDAYFASRPHASQLGAAASPQSAVIEGRGMLEAAYGALAEQYPEGSAVPRPDTWGGLRLQPQTVEFWQGRRDRLHDRLRFTRTADAWRVERLAP